MGELFLATIICQHFLLSWSDYFPWSSLSVSLQLLAAPNFIQLFQLQFCHTVTTPQPCSFHSLRRNPSFYKLELACPYPTSRGQHQHQFKCFSSHFSFFIWGNRIYTYISQLYNQGYLSSGNYHLMYVGVLFISFVCFLSVSLRALDSPSLGIMLVREHTHKHTCSLLRSHFR